jgi:outer membrane immunogenic protein
MAPARGVSQTIFPETKTMKMLPIKKLLLATVALATLGAAAPAFGADLGARPYSKAPVYAAPIYNWTGFYIGGHIGGAFSSSNNFNGLVLNDNSARFLGGVQGGADWQFAPNWVVGVEGQYSWLSKNNLNAFFPGGLAYNNDQRAIGSLTARVGWTWGPGLLYVKGGYAYSDNNDTLRLAGVPVAFALDSNHRDGYTVGGGVEYMFAPNWSAKAEYQYYNFGDSRFVAPAVLVPFGSFHNDEHTVKAGINYRFNFGAPVVARY